MSLTTSRQTDTDITPDTRGGTPVRLSGSLPGSSIDNVDPALRRCWHPFALASEITDQPQRIMLLGEPWVALRLGGQLTILADACPHRLVPLSSGQVVDGTLQCQYHGYRFDADGRCVDIPAQDGTVPIGRNAHCAAPAGVEERFGVVWVAVEEPITPLPEIPEFDDDAFAVVTVDPQVWKVGAGQMADNFLDVGHFPYLHANTFGDPNDLIVKDYSVETTGWTFEARHHNSTKTLRDAIDDDVAADDEFVIVERDMHYVFTAPYAVYLRIDYDWVALVLAFFMQPLDAEHTRLYVLNVRDDIPKGEATPEESIRMSELVVDEDRGMLESLQTRATPLDLTAEHHTRADRITVEMRRMLARLVEETS
ncbi:molybdenum cofactor-independent xanthine hydroxylase subunit HpxD [soil metagenome]